MSLRRMRRRRARETLSMRFNCIHLRRVIKQTKTKIDKCYKSDLNREAAVAKRKRDEKISVTNSSGKLSNKKMRTN
jgi:hypothetical protein